MAIIPIRGWLLDALAELDVHHAGVAGHVIRSSSERRQTIAALLSRIEPQFYSAELGRFVIAASHGQLLARAFGVPVSGLRSALSRVEHIQPRRFYPYLAGLLTAQPRRSTAKTIQRMRRVNCKRLAVLRALPNDLQIPSLIDCIKDVAKARDLRRVIEMFAVNGLDRSEMIRAISRVGTPVALTDYVRRWSYKLSLPGHPVPATDQYRPIEHGRELDEVARRFRNCMRRYLADILDGRSTFAEFEHEAGNAVIHLKVRQNNWFIDDVYGFANDAVSPVVREAVVTYLAQHGVKPRCYDGPPTSPWLALRRLSHTFRFDDDF